MRVLVSEALRYFAERTDRPADVEVVFFDDAAPLPAGDFAGLVPHVARRVDADDLARLPALRVVANFGVGYDNIDMDAAQGRGVAVTNTPGVLTEATAELTWALILATARRLPEGERLVRAGEWTGWQPTQLLGRGLGGRTLGIVGAGRIGQEVGRRARAFGMRVVYWSRTPRDAWAAETGAERRELHELLAESDVVSLHVALAPGTARLIGRDALGRLKRGAVLINTARGAVIDEEALVEALEAGRIRAGLDVYAHEPRVPERLLGLDNVVLLPHLGSATEEARWGMWRLAWANLLCGVRGEPLPNPVLGPGPGAGAEP